MFILILYYVSLCIQCTLTWFFLKSPSEKKTRLSGYGVELAIKSTEYKAKDDTKIEGKWLCVCVSL